MIFKLKDGTQYEVTNSSTNENIYILVNNFTIIDEIRSKLTVDNLAEVTLGETIYYKLPLKTIRATIIDNNNIQVNLEFEIYTEEVLNDKILQLQAMVDAMIGDYNKTI